MSSDRLTPLAGFNEVIPFKIRVSCVRAVFSLVLLINVLQSNILRVQQPYAIDSASNALGGSLPPGYNLLTAPV